MDQAGLEIKRSQKDSQVVTKKSQYLQDHGPLSGLGYSLHHQAGSRQLKDQVVRENQVHPKLKGKVLALKNMAEN